MDSDFPFVKFISPNNLIGMSEGAKVQYLDRVFRDADKSPTSLIVIDEVESILDWVPIGPRFSNSVLQAIKTLIKKPPPKDRRRLIFCTTSERQTLSDLGLLNAFTMELAVPNVLTGQELSNVLVETGAFDERACQQIPRWLSENTGSSKVGVGVKDILEALARSKKSANMVERFVEIMAEECVKNG
jgi:vesicle-fusing ATPase